MPSPSRSRSAAPAQPAQSRALIPAPVIAALDEEQNALALMLAREGDVGRFRELTLDALTKDPKLLRCTPASIIRAVRDMAKLNLEPVLGEAYLVPFWNKDVGAYEATLIIGYHGLQTLAFNSGFVTLIEGDVVRANDEFVYVRGYPETTLRHVPASGDRGDPIGAWAMVHLRDAPKPLIGYLETARIEQRRLVSRSSGNDSSPWQTWRDEMDLKTALRFTLNLAPKSVRARVAQALDVEDAVDALLAATPANPRLEDGSQGASPRRRRLMARLTGAPEEQPASDAPGAADDPAVGVDAPATGNAAGGPVPRGAPTESADARVLCGSPHPEHPETLCNLNAGHLELQNAPQVHRLLESGSAVATWPAQNPTT